MLNSTNALSLSCSMEPLPSTTRSGRNIRHNEPYTPEPQRTKKKVVPNKSKKGKSQSKSNKNENSVIQEEVPITQDESPLSDQFTDDDILEEEEICESDDLLIRLNAMQRKLD